MTKKYLSYFIMFFGVLFFAPSIISATSYEYEINNYDIDIIVNENNTFDITETITVNFNVSKHGIYKKIPLSNIIKRLDGTTSKNRARVTNVSVNNEYQISKSNGYYEIKIGSASKTIIGEEKYIIKYNYNIGKDPIEEKDEFYFNLIGPEWTDTIIKNVTFTIRMPKDFDASKLGFSVGTAGAINNNNIVYNVSENTINGAYNGYLNPTEAFTVRLELEEGYFVGAELSITKETYLLFLIPIIGLFISAFLWYKYGKDDVVIETVEFYPPEQFNSLEVGFLYKGIAANEDVVSLLIYLANKGYIKITETEKTTAKEFKITKLKEYDGNNNEEKIFLEGLFDNGKDGVVTEDDLYNHFYETMDEILSNINSKENQKKIFDSIASSKYFIVIAMIIISLLTIFMIPILDYSSIGDAIISLFLIIFYLPFYAVGLSNKIPKSFRIPWLIFTIFHSSIFFISMSMLEAIVSDKIYLLGFIFGVACIVGMVICFKLLPKRTPYGNEILGKLKGFKNFLETAEKEQLEEMVTSNPEYFYDILPYTYVLGVSDKWIEKFETITLKSPNWYASSTNFSTTTFRSFMDTTMKTVQSTMSSSPSSSGSGSSCGRSSGGGISGGGSGGGGGGSW